MWIELPWPEIRRTLTHDIRKHWTDVSTLLGRIISVYHDLHHWRSNQWPQIAEPKLYNWALCPYRTQVMLNQLVMAIAWLINLNVSCKLHLYSLQRTRSPPGPRLHKRIRNTHLRNYYDLKGKDIDLRFLFYLEELYCELKKTFSVFELWTFVRSPRHFLLRCFCQTLSCSTWKLVNNRFSILKYDQLLYSTLCRY